MPEPKDKPAMNPGTSPLQPLHSNAPTPYQFDPSGGSPYIEPIAAPGRDYAPVYARIPTLAANNITPADIEHLVTTAQEPPTEFQNEVQEELDRLAKAKASKV